MEKIYLIMFFIFGSVFSSFLCVIGYRLPQKISFITGRSRCDNCGHELKFYELIPVLSYIIQGGKCRKCSYQIPAIIPICEIIGGFLFSFAYYLFGFSYNLLFAILIASLFLVVLVTDVNYYIIPDEVIIFFAIAFVITQYFSGGIKNVGVHLLTGAMLFSLMYLTMLLGEKIFKKESLGGGDVKLLFLFGLVLEPIMGIVTIFLASMIALPISFLILIKSKSNMIPFGPFLNLAFLILFYTQLTTDQLIRILT